MRKKKLTYAEAEHDLASILDQVTQDGEKVIIQRRGKPDVAIVSAAELSSLEETVYILSTPANARRFFDALEGAMRGEGEVMTIEELRERFGL